jgi:hypothetical protein
MARALMPIRLPMARCPSCTHPLDGALLFGNADVSPDPGDLTICTYCRTWLAFTDTLGLRLANEDEVSDVDPTLRAIMQQHLDAFDLGRPKH